MHWWCVRERLTRQGLRNGEREAELKAGRIRQGRSDGIMGGEASARTRADGDTVAWCSRISEFWWLVHVDGKGTWPRKREIRTRGGELTDAGISRAQVYHVQEKQWSRTGLVYFQVLFACMLDHPSACSIYFPSLFCARFGRCKEIKCGKERDSAERVLDGLGTCSRCWCFAGVRTAAAPVGLGLDVVGPQASKQSCATRNRPEGVSASGT
jgi:hypothetical protein